MLVIRQGVQIETDKPQIGDLANGRYIGKSKHRKYLFQACQICNQPRWVRINKGNPESLICASCNCQYAAGFRKSFLPKRGSFESEKLIDNYKIADDRQLAKWAKQYGYTTVRGFRDAMRRIYGVYHDRNLAPEVELKPIIELPPVKLREYKGTKVKRGDEEIAALEAADGHAGKITKSYNKEVYKERMGTMFESTMKIVELHRNMYPINTLYIFMLGDNMQGENPFQGSRVGEIEMGARDQTVKIAAPMWNNVIGSFKQHFVEVVVECFPGNHGYERLAPETSREDLRLYDILQAGIGREKGITINIHEEWWGIVNLMGFKFFCFHGDGIPCQQGVPFFALDKKLKAWHMQFGGFNYALGAHFHKRHSDEISSRLEYFMTGSLVSHDDWAVKRMGISSNPSQFIFGVHPRFGVTWRYPVIVDYKFLPEKTGGG